MTEASSFHTEELKDWNSLQTYQRPSWIFRGHSDIDYRLQTSLERLCLGLEWKLNRAPDIEKALLREFKRRYHRFSTLAPEEEHNLEWFSIMQHHGAPTRLLDFSYSVFVAAYFALEGAVGPKGPKDSAIWAINGYWERREAASAFKKGSKTRRYIEASLDKKDEASFRRIINGRKELVLVANPYRLNERLANQKGVFVCPGNLKKSFETNLKNLKGWDLKENVVCLKIPRTLRNKGIESLHYMGISRASLFPGLDGFSQSLQHTMPLIWEEIRKQDLKFKKS